MVRGISSFRLKKTYEALYYIKYTVDASWLVLFPSGHQTNSYTLGILSGLRNSKKCAGYDFAHDDNSILMFFVGERGANWDLYIRQFLFKSKLIKTNPVFVLVLYAVTFCIQMTEFNLADNMSNSMLLSTHSNVAVFAVLFYVYI